MKSAEQELYSWASGSVVRSYRAFRRSANLGRSLDLSDPETGAAMEKVLTEIRRELGQSTLGFQKGELLSLLTRTEAFGGTQQKPLSGPSPERTVH